MHYDFLHLTTNLITEIRDCSGKKAKNEEVPREDRTVNQKKHDKLEKELVLTSRI